MVLFTVQIAPHLVAERSTCSLFKKYQYGMKKPSIIFKTCFEILKHLHMFPFFLIDLKFLKLKILEKKTYW
jgi:hypothetical protein